MSCSKFRVGALEPEATEASQRHSSNPVVASRANSPSKATKRWRTWWTNLTPEQRDERLNKKRSREAKRRGEARIHTEALVPFLDAATNTTPNISPELNFVIESQSAHQTRSKIRKSANRPQCFTLDESIFGIEKGTVLPRELHKRLVQLQCRIGAWMVESDSSGLRFDTRSSFLRGASLELALLERLETAFNHGVDGYEVLRQTKERYAALHLRGEDLENTFKSLVTCTTSKNLVRPLLDALIQHGQAVSLCLFRVRQIDALLCRWRSQDHQVVRQALQERVERASRLIGTLPTGAAMSALKTLGPNQRLNDEVVNSMFILLPPHDHVLVLDSFFYSYILQGEWERLKKHNALIRNGPKLFDRAWSKIIFPVHELNFHWICVCLDFQACSVTVYDSLALSSSRAPRVEVMQNLEKLVSFISRRSPDGPPPTGWTFNSNFFEAAIQHNGYDCGVLTILFAYHLHGGEIDGDHVPPHLRLSQANGSVHGLRLLLLDMLLS